MSGRFIKVVIVGPAGVGKTSLRHQYISGRFATGYRATIGTDFITKTLPHYSQAQSTKQAPTDPSSSTTSSPPIDPVTLQIWDTAGQERFSSLSAAFFRGADAVILVFDVNKPETLAELSRWWDEFRVKVPIADGEEPNYCVVVVGNKMDLAPMTRQAKKEVVGPRMAAAFLSKMIPVPGAEDYEHADDPPEPVDLTGDTNSSLAPTVARSSSLTATRPELPIPLTSQLSVSSSNAATPRPEDFRSPRSRYGTMTSTRTGISVYHTPSSSLFDSPVRRTSRERSGYFPEITGDQAGPSRNPTRTSSRVRYASPDDDDDLEVPMDLEYDYNYEVNTSTSSMSGYATAKSTPFPSSDSSESGSKRFRVGSIASTSSLSTLRPSNTPAINFRNRVIQEHELLPPPSPSRSRKSSASSLAQGHNIATADLPTPSASPPSPPILTASLMAAVHMQQQQAEAMPERELDVGPKLFFTSAKTGSDTPVAEIFAYVAERVVRRWEWEESIEASRESASESDSFLIKRSGFRVRLGEMWKELTDRDTVRGSCCS